MTDAILKLENIVEALSNRDIYSKSMVSTQEINTVMYSLAEEMVDKVQLKAIGVQVRAQLAKMRKRTYKDSMHTSMELRLAKINKDLRAII